MPKLVPQRPLVYSPSDKYPLLCAECRINLNLYCWILSARWSWPTTVPTLPLQIMKNMPESWWATITKYDLKVWESEVLSLGSVFIFAEQLLSFLSCRFLLCYIHLTFKYSKQENPRSLQPGFALLILNVETTTETINTTEATDCTDAQRLLQKCRGSKTPQGLRSVSLMSQYPTTIIPLPVSRWIVNTELCVLEWCFPSHESVFVRVNHWWTTYGSLPSALKRTAGVRIYEESLIFN